MLGPLRRCFIILIFFAIETSRRPAAKDAMCGFIRCRIVSGAEVVVYVVSICNTRRGETTRPRVVSLPSHLDVEYTI